MLTKIFILSALCNLIACQRDIHNYHVPGAPAEDIEYRVGFNFKNLNNATALSYTGGVNIHAYVFKTRTLVFDSEVKQINSVRIN